MQSPLFGSWLEQTAELQRSAYGYDPSDDSDVERWLEYVRNQTLAAFVELGEFIQNLSWKPGATHKVVPTSTARGEAVEELVDVLHFVANTLTALEVSDEELCTVYLHKMEVNRGRMSAGGHS